MNNKYNDMFDDYGYVYFKIETFIKIDNDTIRLLSQEYASKNNIDFMDVSSEQLVSIINDKLNITLENVYYTMYGTTVEEE
jgi:hypothetical protein